MSGDISDCHGWVKVEVRDAADHLQCTEPPPPRTMSVVGYFDDITKPAFDPQTK